MLHTQSEHKKNDFYVNKSLSQVNLHCRIDVFDVKLAKKKKPSNFSRCLGYSNSKFNLQVLIIVVIEDIVSRFCENKSECRNVGISVFNLTG